MRTKNKKAATKRVLVAFPMPLYNAVKESALKDGRSVNGHIRFLAKRDVENAKAA